MTKRDVVVALIVGIAVGAAVVHFSDKSAVKTDASLKQSIVEAKKILPSLEARYHCVNVVRSEIGADIVTVRISSDAVKRQKVPWYVLAGINQCEDRTPQLTLTVKFYSAAGERIGVDSQILAEMAPGEIFAHKWAIPDEVLKQPWKAVTVKAAYEGGKP